MNTKLGFIYTLWAIAMSFTQTIYAHHENLKHHEITSVIVPYLLFDESRADDKIVLPIEVLGRVGTESDLVRFNLTANMLSSADKLWFMVNNLSYENKAEIRINGSDWIPLNHQTVELYEPEMSRGGMAHGGYNTVRFTMPVDLLSAGANRLRFRFVKSDGISIGYRVIRFNVLSASGEKLLSESLFEEDNPDNWTGPFTDNESILEGKALWEGANLWNHYLPNVSADNTDFWYGKKIPDRKRINAKCASCHTQDGRDLEYFSYSNHSIIERSKFHNLTEQQGQKIASYIRSLSAKTDNIERLGRPWNPPYQPGPSVGEKSIMHWAAGAGVDSVLDKDEEMLPFLFPNGANRRTVRDLFDSDKMMDKSVIPLAIQFPDWKHWLPMVHPLDAFKVDISTVSDNDPLQAIEDIQAYFESNRQRFETNGHTESDTFTRKLTDLHASFRRFFEKGKTSGDHWRSQGGDAEKNLVDGLPIEFVKTSFARLLAVKSFEFVNEFNLQDKAHLIIKEEHQPGVRQWPTRRYSVFEIPPHFTANNSRNFEGQSIATGLYESTNWYTLQMVLNPGNGVIRSTQPTDYNYHHLHIGRAATADGLQLNESLRYFTDMNHVYQIRSWSGDRDNDPYGPVEGSGFRMRHQNPAQFIGVAHTGALFFGRDNPEKIAQQLDQAQPGLTKLILDALILQFVKEMERPENALYEINSNGQRIEKWPRVSPNGSKDALDPVTKTTADIIPLNEIMRAGGNHNADRLYGAIPIFKTLNVDCNVLNQLIDWSQDAWPNIDFEEYRERC